MSFAPPDLPAARHTPDSSIAPSTPRTCAESPISVHSTADACALSLQCPRCPFVQTNGRKADLRRHIKTHAEREKIACGRRGCAQTFSREDHKIRHQRNPSAKCADGV
ncbi:hypothetical protein FA95DRAFT_1551514 [Auriscalpium vulgare]|uniref:Uncharacterized protein n=1 Tax=Auriscalpium vulgare TaxID=40419 RepID=A0ACB8R0C8_9AGAM|nr:hypothetical protein FA95DRAFT_1551514 [Auriscalpium vulgare]